MGIKVIPKNGFDGAFTEAQVAHVRRQPKLFLEYVDAIHGRTKNFLETATPDQLAVLVKIPWWKEERIKAFVLAHVIRHSYQHLGEAQYLKGLMSQVKVVKSKGKTKIARRDLRKANR